MEVLDIIHGILVSGFFIAVIVGMIWLAANCS